MKNIKFIMIIFSFFIISLFPVHTEALKMNSNSYDNISSLSISNSFIKYRLDDCNLDAPNDDDSVLWLLDKILDYIKIGGPLIVVIMSSIDFAKVITTGDDDKLAKAKKNLFIRLMLAAMLFFIPVLIQVIMSVFGITGDVTCGISAIQRLVI